MGKRQRGKGLAGAFVLCVLAILWTAFIWSNSAKPAVESSGQSLQVLAVLEPFFEGLGLETESFHGPLRKLAHMTEFALLGILWMGAAGLWWSKERRAAVLLTVTLCMATALIDETIQLFFDGRSGQITDLWVDLAGAVPGMLCSLLIGTIVKAFRK